MSDIAIAIISGVLSGGGLSGILHVVSRRRLTAAQGRSLEVRGELQLVGGAMDMVEQLRTEVRRQAQGHRDEIEKLKERLSRLEQENEALEAENQQLRARCTSLEEKIRALQAAQAANAMNEPEGG